MVRFLKVSFSAIGRPKEVGADVGKLFAVLMVFVSGLSFKVLSEVSQSASVRPPEVSVVGFAPAVDKEIKPLSRLEEITTWELPQQPVYEAPVYVPEWEQSWSGPTTASYPLDITTLPPANPVVNPVLELDLGVLQERITQIQQRVVEQFMQRQTPLFTLPGVN